MLGNKFMNTLSEQYEERLRVELPLAPEEFIEHEVKVFESGAYSGVYSFLKTLLAMPDEVSNTFIDGIYHDLDKKFRDNKSL